MITDFFTKPLQGNLFRKFRDVAMGYKHISLLYSNAEESLSQERVENDGKDILRENIGRAKNGPSAVMNGKNVTWADVVMNVTKNAI